MKGTLRVKPLSIKIKQDQPFAGKVDLYVILFVGKEHYKTSVCNYNGESPTWNNSCIFNITNETHLGFEIISKDPEKRDVLGIGNIELEPLLTRKHDGAWYNIYKPSYKENKFVKDVSNDIEGQILIKAEFIPADSELKTDYENTSNKRFVNYYQGYPPEVGCPYQGYPQLHGYPIPGQFPPHVQPPTDYTHSYHDVKKEHVPIVPSNNENIYKSYNADQTSDTQKEVKPKLGEHVYEKKIEYYKRIE